MRFTTVLLVALALLGAGCSVTGFADGGCRFTADREATVPADGVSLAKVIAEDGSLEIRGVAGRSDVRVRGKACASSEDALEKIELVAEQRGEAIWIETKMPKGWGWGSHATLDLAIEAPEGMGFDVQDGSGSVDVRNVASLALKDSSGGIRVEGVSGDLTIHDGSGGIEVRQVAGNVRVHDGSGGVRISQVGGSVDIEDGSGGMRIEDVEADVTVRDGSGGMTVNDVRGNFTVERDGSGGVKYAEIGGEVVVR